MLVYTTPAVFWAKPRPQTARELGGCAGQAGWEPKNTRKKYKDKDTAQPQTEDSEKDKKTQGISTGAEDRGRNPVFRSATSVISSLAAGISTPLRRLQFGKNRVSDNNCPLQFHAGTHFT
jgi:hypothetical protein